MTAHAKETLRLWLTAAGAVVAAVTLVGLLVSTIALAPRVARSEENIGLLRAQQNRMYTNIVAIRCKVDPDNCLNGVPKE